MFQTKGWLTREFSAEAGGMHTHHEAKKQEKRLGAWRKALLGTTAVLAVMLVAPKAAQAQCTGAEDFVNFNGVVFIAPINQTGPSPNTPSDSGLSDPVTACSEDFEIGIADLTGPIAESITIAQAGVQGTGGGPVLITQTNDTADAVLNTQINEWSHIFEGFAGATGAEASFTYLGGGDDLLARSFASASAEG